MNYFAHGYQVLDEPYVLAGTAVPDWLSVVDRRLRARPKPAAALADDPDARIASVARGIVRHHQDDAWFHETPAFALLCSRLSVAIRQALPPDDSLRVSFLGHILVEILLDAALIADDPRRLEAYYAAMAAVDPAVVAEAVGRLTSQPVDHLRRFIVLFCQERFLWDYADDAKLCYRLNQVMRRVGLPPLGEAPAAFLPLARREVARHKHELLTPAAPHAAA